ncbi:MAG: hypothetical protein WCF82_12935 [Microcoleus sp.]
MIVLEFKAKAKTTQYAAADEAIKTAQFVRHKCVRFWMGNRGVEQKDMYRHNTALRAEYPFVKALNSHACQVAALTAYIGQKSVSKVLGRAIDFLPITEHTSLPLRRAIIRFKLVVF